MTSPLHKLLVIAEANEFAQIGALVRRNAGSLYVQCWAAEQIGESYPLGTDSTIMILNMTPDDEQLGRKVDTWQKNAENRE